jgi:hypothetical protein
MVSEILAMAGVGIIAALLLRSGGPNRRPAAGPKKIRPSEPAIPEEPIVPLTPRSAWFAARKAKKERRDLRIVHQRSVNDAPTTRIVTPLTTYDGEYLVANCHSARKRLTFHLAKVSEMTIVPRPKEHRRRSSGLDTWYDRSADVPPEE